MFVVDFIMPGGDFFYFELKWFNLFNLRQCDEEDSKVTGHLYICIYKNCIIE